MTLHRGTAIAIGIAWVACGPPPAPRSTSIRSIATAPSSSGLALGSVTIGDKRYAADYSFDRNALSSIVDVPGGFIGVTSSGNLLRYDRDTLAITREAVAAPPVRCIAASGGTIYVGVPGGVAVLDPDALTMTRLVEIAGTPRWIGTYAHGSRLAVVTGPDEHELWDRKPEDRREAHATLVRVELRDRHVLAEVAMPVRDVEIAALPTSWLVDDHDRLWYAVDGGEFGGDVERIDLASGAVTPIAGVTGHRVRGFVDAGGDIWAYGGLDHGMLSQGVIARIAGDTAKIVWTGEGLSVSGDDGTPMVVGKGDAPIRLDTAVVATSLSITRLWRIGDHWRALVGHQLYDVTADVSRWKLATRIDATDRVEDAVLVADEPILATRHGLVRIHDGAVVRTVVPGQLDGDADLIATSTAGIFVTSYRDRHHVWHDDGSRWAPIDTTKYPNRDIEVRAVAGHAPWLFVEGTSESPNVVARWIDGSFVEQWRGSGGPSFGVAAIDDTLWSHDDDQLYRFDGHGWTHVGSHPLAKDKLRVMHLRAIANSPLVIDDDSHVLFDVHGRDAPHASLHPIVLAPAVDVVDAVGSPDGSTLVATRAGVSTLAPHATTLDAMPSLPEVRYLARDPSGGIWQASTHELAVSNAGLLKRISIPGLDGRRIAGFAIDPVRGEIAIALGGDGVIRLVAR